MAEAPYVGRAREREELARRWVPGALVTLLGPAGVGKSRLATRLADGGLRVPLRGVRSEADAWDALALALALAPSAEVQGAVAAALVRAPQKLVLDDADEVPPGFVAELAELVGVPLLVTSRQRLGLPAETLFELSPLPADDAAALLDAWLVRLRGRGANDAERPWLHSLARQLDGLPLAIELAAARTRVLGLAALSRRLDETPSALASPRDRTRALDVAFEASWTSLEAWERSALAQLTVFVGGFDADSAEAVVRLEAGAPPLLDVLQELRDRSLLQASDGARLALLRTFAAFVRARSDDALVRSAEERHAEHFARFFARAWDAPDELEARLVERENLLATLDRLRARHAPRSKEAEAALRGLLGLAPLLLVRGPLHALATRLEATLECSARSGADIALLAAASAMAARVHARIGDVIRAEQALGRARLLAAKVGDAKGEVARAGVELSLARGEDPSAWLDALPDDPTSALARAEVLRTRDERGARVAALRACDGDRLVRLAARVVLARLGDDEPLGELASEAEVLGDLASLARLHVLRDGAAGAARARRLAERLGDARLQRELQPRKESVRLRVASDASVVEVDGERVELRTRKSLRGVLRALVDAHLVDAKWVDAKWVDAQLVDTRFVDSPSVGGQLADSNVDAHLVGAHARAPLAWDALLEAGWPGERVGAEAGMQRVRVAISTLRKLGLASVIETVAGGYRITPHVEIETF